MRINLLAMLLLLLAGWPLSADPVIHKFKLWGSLNPTNKLFFYMGWTNGAFHAGKTSQSCLESFDPEQAVAMIDKRYKNFPEKWSSALNGEFLEALTVDGGPCAGIDPFPPYKVSN